MRLGSPLWKIIEASFHARIHSSPHLVTTQTKLWNHQTDSQFSLDFMNFMDSMDFTNFMDSLDFMRESTTQTKLWNHLTDSQFLNVLLISASTYLHFIVKSVLSSSTLSSKYIESYLYLIWNLHLTHAMSLFGGHNQLIEIEYSRMSDRPGPGTLFLRKKFYPS